MAIQKVSSTLEPLTRELAQEWSAMRPLAGERDKLPKRLAFFIRRLKEHDFGSPTWSKALVGDDPKPWRADGQHTSTVLATCDEELFPKDMNVTINTFHLDNIGDASPLFERFDNPASSRSALDRLNTFIAHHDDVKVVPAKFLQKILAGVHYYDEAQEKQTAAPNSSQKRIPKIKLPSARDLGLYLEDSKVRQFAICASRWSNAKHAFMMGKPGIAAEIYASWKAYPIIATAFWDEVMNESNTDSEDDTRELARIFLDWNHRQPPTKQEKFRKQANKIWERYRRNAASAPPLAATQAATPPQAA